MNAKVDQETCIGCTICAEVCPNVFEMKEDGLAHVVKKPVPKESEDCVIEAEESCPVQAISYDK